MTLANGWSSASALGPCTASSPVSSEMSRSRMLGPVCCFWSTMYSQALARLDALTTIISRSSKRYTVQSSTKVPSGVRIPEY